jgi:hypothetical protein
MQTGKKEVAIHARALPNRCTFPQDINLFSGTLHADRCCDLRKPQAEQFPCLLNRQNQSNWNSENCRTVPESKSS